MLTLHRPTLAVNPTEQCIGPAPWIVTQPPGPMTLWAAAHDRRIPSGSHGWPYPLVVQRARGSVVQDLDGNRYLDFAAGNVVGPAGHCHNAILQAIEDQLQRLKASTETDFAGKGALALARELTRIAPGDTPQRVVMTRGRVESLQAVIRIARRHTCRRNFLAFDGAAHQPMLDALAMITHDGQHRRRMSRSTGQVRYLPYGDLSAVAKRLSGSAGRAHDVAAVLVEPIQTGEGYTLPPAGFLEDLGQLCRDTGVLLVIDETRGGMGRTGKMFCCQHTQVVPDLLLVTNGLSGSLSMHAVLGPESILGEQVGVLGATFVSDPIGTAATLAEIALLEKNLISNADRMGSFAMSKLAAITARRRCLGPAKGVGLMLAVPVRKLRRGVFDATELRDGIINEAFRRGLLLSAGGDHLIRFEPALCVNQVQLGVGLDVFEEAVATVTAE